MSTCPTERLSALMLLTYRPRTGMRFPEGAPIFAVEVRSENDYGPAAERR